MDLYIMERFTQILIDYKQKTILIKNFVIDKQLKGPSTIQFLFYSSL